ncbi:MAG: type I-E CRISPR-associated protein Cas7/Cse4/CasC [Thermomicrobiales bacterium]|nr:type I-E CRISPR-associated protein Cas7/Cse4/CasC [Thermomicrobiales bacterium]
MIVELHLLQNFAPANLNRDDTGSPKDCEFGGYRRARISSQAQKRAIRTLFRERQLLPAESLGQRTTRLGEAIAASLVEAGKPADAAQFAAGNLIEALGIKANSKRPEETSYLVFAGADEMAALAGIAENHWETLTAGFAPGAERKKAKKTELPKEIASEAKRALDGHRAADIALFGRMIADLPDRNRDAASQVAHAISTNRVSMEFDFFTAVDDLKAANEAEDAGAGMLGTVEFNSSCFYRYANLDIHQLVKNLGGDRDLAMETIRAFMIGAIEAIPTGKQNTFAAHQPPSFLLATVSERAPLSLANAFLGPVAPKGNEDLMARSIAALDGYWGRMAALYDLDGVKLTVAVDPAYEHALSVLTGSRAGRMSDVIETVLAQVEC